MTIRQRAELWISTESISNVEWKALVREMLDRGLFEDDPPNRKAFVREVIEAEIAKGKIPTASEVAARVMLREEVTGPLIHAVEP
jgi:hypothetical protein